MKQRPLGICDVCGHYAYRAEQLGNQCHAQHHGESCTGRVKDASSDSDWEACPACTEKGLDQAVDCPQCKGAGWLPV